MNLVISCVVLAGALSAGAGVDEGIHSLHLENGLEAVLVEEHANPFVALTAVVEAGALDEPDEDRGASHFLEHLLFHGTEEMSQAELYETVDRIGAYNNASTRADHTVFMMLAPSRHLETAARIQSDMIFRSHLTDEAFEQERGIVSEEIRKDRDREGYRAGLRQDRILFSGTRLAEPVLGGVEDIEGIDADRVRRYWRSHYVPGRVKLLVVGDVSPEALEDVLEATFAKAPAAEPPPLGAFRWEPSGTLTTVAMEGERTHMKIALPGPPAGGEDALALEIVLDLWNQGRFSEDDRPLLSAGLRRLRGTTLVVLEGALPAETTPEEALQRIRGDLARAGRLRPSAEAVARAVREARVEEASLLERPHYYGLMRADRIASSGLEAALGRISALRRVSSEDLAEAARRWLADGELAAVAAGPGLVRGRTPIEPLEVPAPPVRPAEDELHEKEARIARVVLDNGLTVLVESDTGAHLSAFHLLAKHRAAREPDGKEGIADLLHRMLPEGTSRRDAEGIQEDLTALGAELKVTDSPYIPYDDYTFTPEFSYLRLEVLPEDTAGALELLADLVLHPVFPEEAFVETRAQLVQIARSKGQQAREAARSAFRERMFGDHPLASSPVGTPESLERIRREDLVRFHETYFAPDNLVLSVVTPRPAREVLAAVRRELGEATPAGLEDDVPPISEPDPIPEREVVEVGREQAVLYLGKHLEVPREDWPALLAANAVLSDRLALRIREREGLAYAVGSSVQRGPYGTYLAVTAGTAPDQVERVEAAMRAEMADLGRLGRDDLERAVGRLTGRALMRRMPSLSRAYYLGIAELEGEAPGTDLEVLRALGEVTPREARRAARRWLQPEDLIVVEAR